MGQATGRRRHLADYDLTERLKRSDVLMLIIQVKNRIEAFINLPSSTEKRFFPRLSLGLEGSGESITGLVLLSATPQSGAFMARVGDEWAWYLCAVVSLHEGNGRRLP